MKPNTSCLNNALLALLLLITSVAHGQDDPQKNKKYPSLLWEISGNGTTNPSYLYGTMHVSSKIAFHLSDTFFMGIRNADVVALETDPGNWMAEFLETEGDYAISSLSRYRRNFYGGAFNLFFPDNKDFASSLSRDHNMLNGMLHRYSDRSGNFEEDTYLDMFIYQAGRKMGKKIHSLENFKESMEMLEKAEKAASEEKAPPKGLKKLVRDGKNPREILEDAYRNGDLDMLDSISKMMNPSKGYQHWMIDERNRVMAEGMDSIMQAGQVVFTGIGAAHLPGELGVIDRLRAMGYKVRPVNRKVTSKSNKTKKKIMAMIREMDHIQYYAPDSAFRTSVPGKLFETPSGAEHRQYFLPEMTNGAFYAVDRISTFAPLQNMSPEYMLQRIDSLLFENIPGEILEKKRITINGYPAIDISNQTKRGDLQHYCIVATPMEVIIFKVGGTGDYLKRSKTSAAFYDAIWMAPNTPGWKLVTPAHGAYQVQMPGNVISHKESKFTGGYLIHQAQSVDPETGNYYMAAQVNFLDFNYIEDDSFELRFFGERLAETMDYTLTDYEESQVDGSPAAAFEFTHETYGKVDARLMIRGSFYYLLLAKGDGKGPVKFFDSFAFKDLKYDMEPALYQDTSLHFSVNAHIKKGKKTSDGYYDRYSSRKKNDYDSKTLNQVYAVDHTSEGVQVRFHRYSRYYQIDSLETMWNWRVPKKMDKFGNYILSRDSFQHENTYELHVVAADSGSTRRIEQRYYIKHGAVWTLQVNYDAVTGPSPFVKAFLNTFQPSDSLIGEDVFSDHSDEFFVALASSDSMARAYAINNTRLVKFKDRHAPQLIALIDTFNFEEEEESLRKDLIKEVIKLEHEAVEPYLIKTYIDSYDDANLQFDLLSALGNKKEKGAYQLIKQLVDEDTPLTTRQSKITEFFRSIDDSLELTVTLFPDFLRLVEYPEYKTEIYSILAELSDSSLIQPALYEKYLMQILREAKDELKRQSAKENASNYYTSSSSSNSYSENKKLMHLTTLLLPYIDNKQVAVYFERLRKTKNRKIHMQTSLLYLKNGVPVPDSLWSIYTKDLKLRIDLYEALEKQDSLVLFDSKYATQEELLKGLLFQKSFDQEKDSLVFVGKYETAIKGEKGWVYFFKSKEDGKDEWRLAYAGMMSADTAEVSIKTHLQNTRIRIADDDEMEKVIEEKLKLFRTYERERARGESSSRRSYSDYY